MGLFAGRGEGKTRGHGCTRRICRRRRTGGDSRRSRGGLPIIALPSTAGSTSRIVARLNGPATIPRSEAGLIVTEFGIADLRGKTMKERLQAMLDIASPQHQDQLERELSRMNPASAN